MSYTLDLEIDDLVVHGIEGVDADALGAALREELGRLFLERGVPPSLMAGRSTARVGGKDFTVAPGAGAGEIAGQIAQAVYSGLAP